MQQNRRSPDDPPLPLDHVTQQAIAAGYALAGFAVLAWHGRVLLREAASRRWPCADGVVLQAERFVLHHSGRHGRVLMDVEPAVTVEYRVDGAVYQTRQLRWAGTPAWAVSRILARYPVGARVRVAYDPANPECAVLEPGPTLMRVGYVVLGLASVAGGLVALWFTGAPGAPTP